MNLLPLAETDPRLLCGLVRRKDAELMPVSLFHTKYTKLQNMTVFDILAGLLGYRITELTVNLKSTDTE